MNVGPLHSGYWAFPMLNLFLSDYPQVPWCELDENQVGGIQIEKKKLKKNVKLLLKGNNWLATVHYCDVFSVSWQSCQKPEVK